MNLEKRILVVDDEATIRELVRDTLENFGYRVDIASNAEEAISLIERNRFNLVLSDDAMTGLNGSELCKIVKGKNSSRSLQSNSEYYQSVPFIIMSGHSEMISSELLKELGAYENTLKKPFELNELFNLMRKLLPIKILYIDDDEQIRSFISLQIETYAPTAEVIIATNGKEGYEAYKRNRPDLVITDKFMKEGDGYGLAKQIREDSNDKLIPIFMVSGLRPTEDVEKAFLAGVNEFFSKPELTSTGDIHLRVLLPKYLERMRLSYGVS